MKSKISELFSTLQLVVGILSIIISLSSLLVDVFNSKVSISLLCIGFFLVVMGYCNYVKNAMKESFGVIVNKFSKKQLRLALVCKYMSFVLLLYPIYAIFTFLSLGNKCRGNQGKVGLCVAQFTTGIDDDISIKIFNLLEEQYGDVDSISVLRISRFVNIGSTNYFDSLKLNMTENCIDKGILIFGKRSVENSLFECKLFMHKYLQDRDSIFELPNKSFIYIRNPDLIDFSIETQANTVVNLVRSIVYYDGGMLGLAKEQTTHTLSNLSPKGHNKIASTCKFILGNIGLIENRIDDAVKEYGEALKLDSNNSYLYYNLGTAYLKNSDIDKAKDYYSKAEKLNAKLINPIIAHESGKKEKNESPHVKRRNDQAKFNYLKNYYVIVVDTIVNKYGIIGRDSKVIIDFYYDYISEYLIIKNNRRYFIVRKNGKFGAIDDKGMEVVKIALPTEQEVRAKITVE